MEKIILEKSKCIGCGNCQAICPKFFEMGEDGYSRLKNSKLDNKSNKEELEVKDIECAKEAERGCPAGAIKIE